MPGMLSLEPNAMATENEGVPPSTEVSPLDLQLSACAIEGTHAHISSNTVRLAVGQLIGGRYRIERELGEGGMGVVYLATDDQVPGERFAVKVLKEEPRPEALALLCEEVHKTRKLSHPNIVDVHSVNVDGQTLYVLMEYLEGKSLDKLLDEEFGRGMSFSHAWPIIEDVGAALGNAHDHNVIHSDLKPANVLLTTSGRTKLLDFGIARVSRGPLLHARTGPLALTPGYASCEMLEGKEADRRDDIYSFACVIYEMLCGERPFGELTALEARQAGSKVLPLERLSREQDAALAQALAFDREGRTPSVEVLLGALGADRTPHRRPVAVLGTAIVAALAAVGLTYVILKFWVPRHSAVVQSIAPTAEQATTHAVTVVPFNPPPRSIAVLPFVDMSEKHDQEYFSDGLSEELIDSLTKIHDLYVPARTSSFFFKGKPTTISEIAKALNVANVLEGSVRKSGNRLRITAQLVRADNGYHLWSETYDRQFDDIFKIQDEISAAVIAALKASILNKDASRATPTASTEAYTLYLQARAIAENAPQLADYQRAIDYLQRALKLDPAFARAWAALASYQAYAYEYFTYGEYQGVRSEAQYAASRALDLDPKLSDAHMAMSQILYDLEGNWTAAELQINEALALDPYNADALIWASAIARVQSRFAQAIEYAQKAIAQDPLNAWAYGVFSNACLASGRLDDAESAWRKALKLAPTMAQLHFIFGVVQIAHRKPAEALEKMEEETNVAYRDVGRALALDALGRKNEADRALAVAEAKYAGIVEYPIAQVYAGRHEPDEAFVWLERAYQRRSGWVPWIPWDPLLNNLRKDPRFTALLRKLNLPE